MRDELVRLRVTYKSLDARLHIAQQEKRLPFDIRAECLLMLVTALEIIIMLERQAYGTAMRLDAATTNQAVAVLPRLFEDISEILSSGEREVHCGAP